MLVTTLLLARWSDWLAGNTMTTLSIEEFRRAARNGHVPQNTQVRTSLQTRVDASADSRTLTFTISNESVDRHGDTISASGWKLDAFRRNPIVLWAHDSRALPVARAPKVWIEGNRLKAKAEFTPPGLNPMADTVLEMYRRGFLNATSVGFVPLKFELADDPNRHGRTFGFGVDFLEQELVEFSCVPVPSNSDALLEARAVGLDIGPIRAWARAVLGVPDTVRPSKDAIFRAKVERVKRELTLEVLRRNGGC
jgi:HK97 family phage prohead protease